MRPDHRAMRIRVRCRKFRSVASRYRFIAIVYALMQAESSSTNRKKMNTLANSHLPERGAWGAVGSLTMCVAMLIASEFMPVSLLSPIAADLHVTEGVAGQAIAVSGLFAVITSLTISAVASRFNRRLVLIALTTCMLMSLILNASAPNFFFMMVARALLGITIGGFWSLSTATVMQLVPKADVPKALGVMYMGNAAATAFAAPIGSYLGHLIGWRGVFWAIVPLVLLNLIWQWRSLPAMPSQARIPVSRLVSVLCRPHVLFSVLATMLTFAGAFAVFTYLRPFLENSTKVSPAELSLLLLALGTAAFLGTYGATALLKKSLYPLLRGLPAALAFVTLAMLMMGGSMWAVALMLVAWGALNAALPVTWFNWLAQEVGDEPEVAGGIMVGAIQLAIMSGAALGGVLLDHFSVSITFVFGAALLLLAALAVGRGTYLRSNKHIGEAIYS